VKKSTIGQTNVSAIVSDMQFTEVISSIALLTDLRRIAKARLYDVASLKEEELRDALAGHVRQYSNFEALTESLEQALNHSERKIRLLTSVILREVLLQHHDYSLVEAETAEEVMAWEQAIIDDSKEPVASARKIENFDTFKFVVEAAWENDGNISIDEHRLIERIRNRFKITEKEYRTLEAELGKYPTEGNELHSREDIKQARLYLQESGLLLTFRNSDGQDCDVVPAEMASPLRILLGIPLRRHGYRELLKYKRVRQKDFLQTALIEASLSPQSNLTATDLRELCMDHILPENLLGGYSPRDGLEKGIIGEWCRDLRLPVSGSKDELIGRIIEYYDDLVEIDQDIADERESWFEFYLEFARRDYEFLRQRQLIEKDLDVEHRFEAATDYLFEKLLNHKPLSLPGSEQPDGALSHGDKRLLWDNKSVERQCNLKKHIGQFSRYFNKYSGGVTALLVIAPDFTAESANEALLFEVNTGQKISLITSEEIKQLALDWNSSKHKDEPFPLRFLRSSGRFNMSIAKAAYL
jgi:hypothetical protein